MSNFMLWLLNSMAFLIIYAVTLVAGFIAFPDADNRLLFAWVIGAGFIAKYVKDYLIKRAEQKAAQ